MSMHGGSVKGAVLAGTIGALSCGTSSGTSSESDTGSDGAPTTTPSPTTSGPALTTSSSGSDDGSSDGPGVPEIDCGAVEFASGAGLRRYPYLQSIDDISARVVWTTTTGGEGVVRFAPSPDGPWTDVAAAEVTYRASYTMDTEDYVAYDATLPGLEPNSAYCYEVVEDGRTLASGLSFETAWAGAHRPVRILAFGDSGAFSAEQMGLRDQMVNRQFDVFLHLGDMAYGSGTHSEFEERVFLVYRDLLHKVPTYPAIGNHEYGSPNAQPYKDVYYLWEQALRPKEHEHYYSFDYGNIHFVSLDSNPEVTVPIFLDVSDDPTDMLDWLERDLANSDKPWKIAFFHHPPYSSGQHGSDIVTQNMFAPVLEAGGVDLVLAGHDHHYERSVAIKGGEPVGHIDGGIYFFVVGSGGAGLRDATGDWWTETVDDQNHAFLDLVIEGCGAHGEAVGIDGDIVDSFDLEGCEE